LALWLKKAKFERLVHNSKKSLITHYTLPFLPGGHNPLFGEPLFGVMFLKENIRGLCMFDRLGTFGKNKFGKNIF
jgi:hypothetical protein